MPTVTVLAWCLIASIGPGQLLDRLRERGGEVLDHRARRADLAELDLVRVERHDTGRVPQHRREPHRGAGLERAVVDAVRRPSKNRSAQRLELTAERGAAGRRLRASELTSASMQPARLAQRARRTRRSRARLRSRTGGPAIVHSTNARSGCTTGTEIVSSAGAEARLRRRRRSRSAPPCARGRSRSPWRRRRRSSRAARPRTRGSSARPRGRCASCPR